MPGHRLLATAFFFFLHHLGDQLPYDLAVERFRAELESDLPDEGHAKGYKSRFEYCQMSSAVLAGARGSATTSSAIRSAVVLKESKLGDVNRRHCMALKAAVGGDEDDDAPFFLHLHPVDVADLPDDRQPHGFDNLDFDFLRFGFRDRRCTALRILPDYALAAIHTGQYVPGEGRLWEQRVDVESPQLGSARGAPLARESLE